MLENTQLVTDLLNLPLGEEISRKTLTFDELFNIAYPVDYLKDRGLWFKFEIHAEIKEDVSMGVWNGKHPVDENIDRHIAKAGTRVRVWMASRFGDVGITDNLIDPKGYDVRVNPEILSNFTLKRIFQ